MLISIQGVLISGVEKYTNVEFGTAKCVLYIEVSECPDRGVPLYSV